MIALKRATENRYFPRIQLNKPVIIRLPGGEVLKDDVQDVSRFGFQLRCNRAHALIIHPDQTAISETQSPRIRLRITFPYPDNLPEIDVLCHLRYLNVIKPDELSFGIMFDEFSGDGALHFDRFIQQCLMPVPPPLI